MSLRSNLELAQKVLTQIKTEVVTSNDIIPRTKIPVISYAEMTTNYEKFGDKLQEMIDYQDYTNRIRSVASLEKTIAQLEKTGQPAPMTTYYIAITMMGVGECADTSNLAMALLCQNGCESLINVISLGGVKPNGEPFEHALVVIGNSDPITENLSSFAALSDDCTFIDPLTSVIGQANKILTLDKETAYLRTFNVTSILDSITIDPKKNRETIEVIMKNAKEISDEWSKIYGKYTKKATAKEEKAKHNDVKESTQLLPAKFAQSLATAVCNELKRITAKDWRFSNKEQCSYLVLNESEINRISTYLEEQGITHKKPRKVKDKPDFLIAVNFTSFELLKAVKPIESLSLDKDLQQLNLTS
jgi:hypothetical protein